MKKITELTDQEVLDLTQEKLASMVKFEMAEKGVKILPIPQEPEYLELPDKEITVFKVKGIDQYFTNRDAADQAGEMLKRIKQSMVSIGYNHWDYSSGWAEKESETNYSFNGFGDVTVQQLYKKETAISIADIVEANKNLKKDYDSQMADYNDAAYKSKAIRSDIEDVFYEIKRRYDSYETMKSRYDEYLSIADSDEKMAMKFLKKAYDIDQSTENFIKYGSPENPVLSV